MNEPETGFADPVIANPADVATRLADLDLGADVLATSVLRALSDASTTTRHDPPSMRGFLAWGKSVRHLRDALVPRGWAADDTDNYSTIVHPEGGMAIAVASGSPATGRAVGSPTTLHPKGPLTGRAVIDNRLSFADIAPFPGTPSVRQTWLLLFYLDEELEEVRLELSLPSSISASGLIESWGQRIILPPRAAGSFGDLQVPVEPSDSVSDDLDVPVARRTS